MPRRVHYVSPSNGVPLSKEEENEITAAKAWLQLKFTNDSMPAEDKVGALNTESKYHIFSD